MTKRAFTLIELLVVISIIALLISILLPSLASARTAARQMQNNTQLRGIHMGFALWSQSNKELYPGLVSRSLVPSQALVNKSKIPAFTINGNTGGNWALAGGVVSFRYLLALQANLFPGQYLISPGETNPAVQKWDASLGYDAVGNPANGGIFYSYALPRILTAAGSMSEGRAAEWEANTNSQAVVVSDRLHRNLGLSVPATASTHVSLWDIKTPGVWIGGVAFNDGHVEQLRNSEYPKTLSYKNVKTAAPDNLFGGAQAGVQDIPSGAAVGAFNAQQIIRDYDTTTLGTE